MFCHPIFAWDWLVPKSVLQCEDEQARELEYALRMRLYSGEVLRDDQVEDGAYCVPRVIRSCGWGIEPNYIRPEHAHGAYKWDPPIKTERDLERIKIPTAEYDPEATQQSFEYYRELFDDILQVRIHGVAGIGAVGLMDQWTSLRGIDQTYMDLAADPELVHEGMRRLMEGKMAELDSLEEQDLLSLNNTDNNIGSGGSGFTHELPASDFTGQVRVKDLWGFAEAQTMAPVSPAMYEEFVLQCQAPLLNRFGLAYFGCCEPLHAMIPALKRLIPNLRKVSISCWADKRISAQELGPNYVFECKSDPMTFAASEFDEEAIRKDIRATIALTKEHDCPLEFVSDTVDNIRGEIHRVSRWVQIVREESSTCSAVTRRGH